MILSYLLIPTSLYCGVLLYSAFVLWTKQISVDSDESEELSAASIVVAVRDEEIAIAKCIKALRSQSHHPKQIVVSNDDSKDKTKSIIESLIDNDQLKGDELLLVNRDDLDLPLGKAGALHNGIISSNNSIIVTTDADCTPPKDWLRHMVRLAQNKSVGVVAGLTCIRGDSALDRIQNYDWIYLQSASAALSLLGLPVTAMGNNMAFSRSAYESTGGYPNLPSSVTEDFVLFKNIPLSTGKAALVIPDEDFKNYTGGVDSWAKMFNQRKRWALGGFAGGPLVWLLYGMTSLAHWSILVLLLILPVSGLAMLGIKLICDRLLIDAGLYRLKEKSPGLLAFLSFQGWLLSYMTILPLAILFRPKVSWKGRTFGQDLKLDTKTS